MLFICKSLLDSALPSSYQEDILKQLDLTLDFDGACPTEQELEDIVKIALLYPNISSISLCFCDIDDDKAKILSKLPASIVYLDLQSNHEIDSCSLFGLSQDTHVMGAWISSTEPFEES